MQLVPLYKKSGDTVGYTMVDDDYFETAMKTKWFVLNGEYKGKFYRYARSGSGGKAIYLHRVVAGARPDQCVDHLDHDTLNNQRDNLRAGDRSANMLNRTVHRNNKLGVRGVYLENKNSDRPFTVEVVINHKRKRNRFSTIREAVKWRDLVLSGNA